MSHLKLPPYQKPQRNSSYAGFPSVQRKSPQPQVTSFDDSFKLLVTAPLNNLTGMAMIPNDKIPSGYAPMEHQVAGHTFQVGADEIGMLTSADDQSILKPGGSAMCAAREIKFYEQLQSTTDPDIVDLRQFTAEYRGVVTLSVGNKTVKFIKLRDFSHGMLEPCVIDLKMGRRTWDPMATAEKRKTEEEKYSQCKTTVGFCIPGFQTFHIASEKYKKFGKEYGKKLDESSVMEAFRLFLNADTGLNRQLITSILTNLWAIQRWMQAQKTFRFFSTSILIVYDARRLRQIQDMQKRQVATLSPLDAAIEAVNEAGDLSKAATKIKYQKLQRSHSAANDYDQEMRNIKSGYQQMLDNLVGAYDEKKEWVHVKMIDFAHTFTCSELSDENATGLDLNYLQGIDSLVKIFETLLKMCEA